MPSILEFETAEIVLPFSKSTVTFPDFSFNPFVAVFPTLAEMSPEEKSSSVSPKALKKFFSRLS